MHEITVRLATCSATLLLRMQLLEKSSSEMDNVNYPRGGDKKQCQIPTWGVHGDPQVGHEIDKWITGSLISVIKINSQQIPSITCSEGHLESCTFKSVSGRQGQSIQSGRNF